MTPFAEVYSWFDGAFLYPDHCENTYLHDVQLLPFWGFNPGQQEPEKVRAAELQGKTAGSEATNVQKMLKFTREQTFI